MRRHMSNVQRLYISVVLAASTGANNSHVDQPAAVLVGYGRVDLRFLHSAVVHGADMRSGRSDCGGLFHAFFLVSVIRRFGVFVALLVSYIIAALTALWYFGFLREIHTHVLDLGSHLGIGVCVCVIATGLFLACHAVWKEFKTPNSYYTGN